MSSARLSLPAVTGDLGNALVDLRFALSEQLLGQATERPFTFAVEDDDGGFGAPAWSDAGGNVMVSKPTAEALAAPELEAVAALAHQMIHSIGDGPAFVRLEEQLLEEAITETLTQCYLGAFLEALGGQAQTSEPLFRGVGGRDIEITRPTAANVSVERFGRLAAWLDDVDGDAEPEELEAAAIRWAIKLKAIPGGDRFPVLAIAAVQHDGGEDDDIGAQAFLVEYLRGYMKQLDRSTTGFAGLDYASARAWDDRAERPPALPLAADEWRAELAVREAVTLAPLPKPGAVRAVMAAPASPEVTTVVRRSLDTRMLLWSARHNDAARQDSATPTEK